MCLYLEVGESTSTIQHYPAPDPAPYPAPLPAPNPKLFDVFVLRGGEEYQHHTALSSTSSDTSSSTLPAPLPTPNPKLFDVFVLLEVVGSTSTIQHMIQHLIEHLIQHPTQSCLMCLYLEVVGSTSTIQHYPAPDPAPLPAPNPKLFDVFVLRGGGEHQHHTTLSST